MKRLCSEQTESVDDLSRLDTNFPSLEWSIGQIACIFHIPKDVLKKFIFPRLTWEDLRALCLTSIRFYADTTFAMRAIAKDIFQIPSASLQDLNIGVAALSFFRRTGREINYRDLGTSFGLYPSQNKISIKYVAFGSSHIYDHRDVITKALEHYGSWAKLFDRNDRLKKRRKDKDDYANAKTKYEKSLIPNRRIVINAVLNEAGFVGFHRLRKVFCLGIRQLESEAFWVQLRLLEIDRILADLKYPTEYVAETVQELVDFMSENATRLEKRYASACNWS